MPVSLANMAAQEASVSLTIGDETLTIVYYPNKLTTRSITQLDQGLDGMNQTLSQVIKSWDLLNEDGSVYPTDADSLSGLGIGILITISKAIVSDIRPN